MFSKMPTKNEPFWFHFLKGHWQQEFRFQSSLGGGYGEKNGLFPFASPHKSEKVHGRDKQLSLKQNSKLC